MCAHHQIKNLVPDAGLEEIDSPVRFRGATRDSLAFPAAYEDMKIMLAGRSAAIVETSHNLAKAAVT